MYLKRFISSVLLAISIFASVQAADRQSVGLVLSGGGARGIAHVGVIQALEENNVSIDYITGTSMGAIIGSLYAMGYSPAEMMQLLESKEFIDWATGVINPKYTYYLLEKTPTPAQFNINLGKDGEDRSPLGEILPTSVVNPIPMSFGFMEIYGGATAQCGGNFDKLFVPLRTVCSDVYHKHKVVLSKGPLGDAVRASMSFPMIYQPIEIDSTLMYDGGIYDNYPFDVMRKDFDPDIMIGVDVSTPAKKPEPGQIMSQLETMIVQKSDYNLPADWGISLRIDLKKYPLFDWNNSRAIYEEGYQKGLSMIDSIKQRVTARTLPAELAARRAEWHKGTPRLRFDSITVAGVNPQQREYLTHIFETHKAQTLPQPADTFGVIHARNAFYRAVSPGRFKELTPHAIYKPDQGLFTLNLDATMKRSFDVSAGGYLTTSSNSYLFFGGAYNNLTKHVTNADFSVWVGQSFMGALTRFKYGLSTSTPMSIGADMAIMRQKFYENDKMFYEFNSPLSLIQSQFYTQTHWRVATSRRSFFETGLGYGHLWSSYYPSFDSPLLSNEKEQTVFDLAQLYLKWDMSTLDNLNYPVTGSRITARLSGVTGAVKDARGSNWLNTKRHETYWTSLRAQATHYFPVIDKFSLGVMGDVLLSTRKLLDTYDGSMVSAPTFTPTASCYSSYNPGFRANSWVAVGLDPVWHPASIFQVRGSFNCFLPTREILAESDNLKPYYGSWFSSPKFFGEIRAMLTNPYTILSAWGNYKSSPTGIWSAGLSIGVFVLPPNFL